MLQKLQDITTFLHKSFTDLDGITKNQVTQKSEIFIDQSFKPLSLNIRKAMEIVKKFEMMWPNVDQDSSLKIFGKNNADKLGLYGSVKQQAAQPAQSVPLARAPAPPMASEAASAAQAKPPFGKHLQQKVDQIRNSRRNSVSS